MCGMSVSVSLSVCLDSMFDGVTDVFRPMRS